MDLDHEKLRFFRTAAELRKWLGRNGAKESCLWIGFYKVSSKKAGITYSEALDEALCFGWIDGIRKALDDISYTIRFTPRRPRSVWSNVNIERVRQLTMAGRMAPPGMREFERRTPERSGIYSFEQRSAPLPPRLERMFKANRMAWSFFLAQPSGYRRAATWWVVSAKKDATRERRLTQLIADSAAGRRIKHLAPAKG